jgi:hypothetical protein
MLAVVCQADTYAGAITNFLSGYYNTAGSRGKRQIDRHALLYLRKMDDEYIAALLNSDGAAGLNREIYIAAGGNGNVSQRSIGPLLTARISRAWRSARDSDGSVSRGLFCEELEYELADALCVRPCRDLNRLEIPVKIGLGRYSCPRPVRGDNT